jgi:hypothetical protein
MAATTGTACLMSDLDSEIIGALVAGESERDVAARLGCDMAQVRAVVDEGMRRMFPQENVAGARRVARNPRRARTGARGARRRQGTDRANPSQAGAPRSPAPRRPQEALRWLFPSGGCRPQNGRPDPPLQGAWGDWD